ncbi:MAG: anti-sigma factor antagonist, partial [Lentisphaeria bacterium]|nr:anti-sigma factor antagonist [Lentisphaeria bacterium]
QKQMLKQGSMKLRNLSDNVREVFEMTGFADIMTIE